MKYGGVKGSLPGISVQTAETVKLYCDFRFQVFRCLGNQTLGYGRLAIGYCSEAAEPTVCSCQPGAAMINEQSARSAV
jgi:hypothetical protein